MTIYLNTKTKEYTLKQKNEDGSVNENIVPAKFSPEDKWGKYRRIARKREEN